MMKESAAKRLTETWPGRLASWLLAVVWIVSMPAVDSNAYSVWPFLIVLSAVALLFVSGMLFGGKVVRIPWPGWLMLGFGGYFLVRCLCSYSLVESWLESSLIVSCGVFYVAGIYGAQTRNARVQVTVIFLAVVLNLMYLYVRPGEINMLWTGRPEYGLSGYNNQPVTLLVYKNFAGAFQMIAGSIMLGLALWVVRARYIRLLCLVLAGISVGSSFMCSTRVVYLLAPVLICMMWSIQLIMELFTRDKLRKVTLFGGVILVSYVMVELVNVFLGGGLKQISDINTHLRFDIWKPVLNLATSGPLWGWGTMAAHWEIIGEFNFPATPNVAHNEYVQVWADYGILGLGMMLAVLLMHTVMGLRGMASDSVSALRRGGIAVAMVTLWAYAIAATSDAYWHSYAFATLCAYCCGFLASPVSLALLKRRKVAREPLTSVPGVKVQGKVGRGILGVLSVGIVGFTCWQHSHLSEAWEKQWLFNDWSRPGADDSAEKRLVLLEQIMNVYPAPEVADNYFKLPHYGGARPESETVLRKALEANPRQGYTIIMLVTLLGHQARYEEAEILMRRYYPQEGYLYCGTSNWPFYYYYNLLRWGETLIETGQQDKGMSIVEYALNMQQFINWHVPGNRYVRQDKLIEVGGGNVSSVARARARKLKKRLELLKKLGEQKDDSWMQPMEPGGKTALYPQWGIRPAAVDGKKSK